MNKEEKIDLIERRIRLLSVWKEIINRRKAFKPMQNIFNLLEADYDKCIVPDEKEMVYTHFRADNQRIISTKLGKYLVKNYKDLVPEDHILSDFVSTLNSIMWKKPPQINVYKGEDIITGYKRCGDTGAVSSCMSRNNRHLRMKLLALNPDKVELQCLEDAEEIYARVLVWTLEDGKKVVDRIYPNDGVNFHKALDHYKNLKNHYIRSNHKAICNSNKTITIGDLGTVTIVLNCKDVEEYPYLDTFQHGHIEDDKLILTSVETNKSKLVFDSQYGIPNEI